MRQPFATIAAQVAHARQPNASQLELFYATFTFRGWVAHA